MKTLGIHHISTLVSDIHTAFEFYHKVLGMRLLMKTVNQDDTAMYHLFFSDEQGRPGTEFTVFQINTFKKNTFGTNAIERAVFLVKSEAALTFWLHRLEEYNIEHCGIEDYAGTKIIRFEDSDGMKLGISFHPNLEGTFYPNTESDIPTDFAIIGFHSVHLRVRYPKATKKILTDWFDFKEIQKLQDDAFPVTILKNNNSDFQHEVHLIEDHINPLEDQGIGGIHHLALYAEDYDSLLEINEAVINRNFVNSGLHPREFFDALYFREPNGILFEVASVIKKVPHVTSAENIDEVPLYLPDFLEPKRERIETELNKIENYRKNLDV